MLTVLRSRVRDEAGITIVELLVVIVLMSIIGSIATATLVRGMQESARTQSRFEALGELQKSVDRMTRELRAGAPLQVGGPGVVEAGDNRVVVYVYRNNFTELRRFTYQYCPSTRRLHVRAEGPSPAPSGNSAPPIDCATTSDPVLVDRINNTGKMFTYFTAANPPAPTTTPSQVKTIRVSVRRMLSDQVTPIEVTTIVRLRNVR